MTHQPLPTWASIVFAILYLGLFVACVGVIVTGIQLLIDYRQVRRIEKQIEEIDKKYPKNYLHGRRTNDKALPRH